VGFRVPSAADLLDVWDRGSCEPSVVGRGLALLDAARPGHAVGALARVGIGERDADLLALRAAVFGDKIVGLAACGECGENVELTFTVADITVASTADRAEEVPLDMTVDADGYEIRVRPLDSLDLEAILGMPDVPSARMVLLRRSVLAANRQGTAVAAEDLPADVLDAVEERLAAADPQADVQLALCCPGCGATWQQAFDIVSFLWAEVDAWARRTVREVHLLASAYGWPERDILGMSAPRRRAYLDLVLT
jgi:hypothetical protein